MFAVDHLPAWIREYRGSLITLCICLSIGFVGLVLMTQLSMIEDAHSSSRSSFNLSHDVSALRTQWSQIEPHAVQERMAAAERMLLRDLDHVTMWLQQMGGRAASMGLRSKYRVHGKHDGLEQLNDVEVIPVSLEVFPEQSTVLTGAYERYVDFLRSLAEDQVRVDVQEVKVRGGAGAAQMTVLIHVWVKATT
ncbi:MAG: hypothetical protein NPIRA02_18940 [Nitrospirales bacterium]|nr:MAG: hypothetical protein NPIRA02_18940 [Nitrospirales bacterium]